MAETTAQTRALSHDRIVRAALAIADEDGLQAVTMRRVAASLDTAAMSLYRHVPNKDALLEAMADHVLAKLPNPDPAGAWQQEMHDFFLAFYDLMLEHPAVAHLTIEMVVTGPELTARGELVLACLLGAGLDEATVAQAITAFLWHAAGGALYAIARRNAKDGGRDERLRDLPRGAFPAVERVAPHLERDAGREHFEATLRHLIRGYEPA
jgi:AcrR family transcriptional regulator